jgi:ubiquinone/menaquinone biosynthesis C-methylase UbiE
MTNETIDPREFKSTQREAWGAVAEGWRKWWRVFEAGAQTLNDRIVALAGVKPGHRVLDVAAGIGEPALTAARAVGPEGSVLATDLAPEMMEVARERASADGVANVEFREMDAEKLDLAPQSFDAAVSRWGLMLMMDPLAACRGVRAALKPGARFAAAVWGAPERVPFLAIPHVVAARVLAVPAPPPGTPGAFAMADEGRLAGVLSESGFREVRSETVSVTFDFESPGEYASFLSELSGSLRKSLMEQPEAVQARVWREVEASAREHRGAGGRLRFVNEVRCASGLR